MTSSTQASTMERRYPPAPLVGVGAAVFDEAGRVLLVLRGRPPRQGQWGLPGGLLDLGERLHEGVRREVREECGIEIRVGGIADVFEPILRDEDGCIEYHYVVIDFWAQHVSGTAVAADDADAVAWVAMEELDGYGLAEETHSVVIKAHAAWNGKRQG